MNRIKSKSSRSYRSRSDSFIFNRFNELEREVAGISTAVRGIEDQYHSLIRVVENLRNDFRTGSQTDWKTVIAAIALIVTIGALALAPVYQSTREISAYQKQIQNELRRHKENDGHRPMTQRVKALEAGVDKLDNVLQREMRLLDQESIDRIQYLEKILHREIQSSNELMEQRLLALDRIVQRIENEQSRRTTKVYTK